MLAVTEAAADAISTLTRQGQQDAGLRLEVRTASQAEDGREAPAELALSVAPGPEEGDRVVGTEAGAQVFLEPRAAELLADKVLDLQQDEQGQVSFAVLPQPPGQPR